MRNTLTSLTPPSSSFLHFLQNRRADWGARSHNGEIHIQWDFTGPPGVAYPARQPQVDSFDESGRKDRAAEAAEQQKKAEEAFEQAEKMRDEMLEGGVDTKSAVILSEEFTDKEIFEAFRFVDLDHNMFVGASEIRHVLVCMGEMVTDEEVDEMIRMLDLDGDGQISCVTPTSLASPVFSLRPLSLC